MRLPVALGILIIVQLCVGSRIARNINQYALTASMLYNGETENVRSSLNGYMEPEQLEKFLNSIQKLRQNAPQAEHRKGFREIFAMIFASKTTTSEEDWTKIISGDRTLLSEAEIKAINTNREQSPDDKWRLLKKLAQLRMSEENANHIIEILNKMRTGATIHEINEGRKELMAAALAAVSGKRETETRRWIL